MQKDFKAESTKKEKRPVIGIRADGNEILGMGHLMRCMSIGRELEKQGAQCVFFAAGEQAGSFLRERGFFCEVLHTDYQHMEEEIPLLNHAAEKYAPKLWLVDSYQITQKYLRELGKICPVFYLDDTGQQIYEAEGLINYNICGEDLGYEALCSQSMKLLLGAKYAPVKEEFVTTPYCIRQDVENVLITMGGSDKLNITGMVCQSLLEKLPEYMKFTLICGRFNPHLAELVQLKEGNERVFVKVDVPDMWNKLAAADVVVTAAGSTMYELSAMGIPSVCCYYVENQRRIAEGFAHRVGLCNGGDYSAEPEAVLERLAEAVQELVYNKEKRMHLAECMKQVSDGHGARRIANELLQQTEP